MPSASAELEQSHGSSTDSAYLRFPKGLVAATSSRRFPGLFLFLQRVFTETSLTVSHPMKMNRTNVWSSVVGVELLEKTIFLKIPLLHMCTHKRPKKSQTNSNVENML